MAYQPVNPFNSNGLPQPCGAQLPYSLVHRSEVEDGAMERALDASGASVVASFVLVPVYMVVIGIPLFILFAIAGAAGEDASPVVLLVGFPFLGLFVVGITVLLYMALMPLMLRAALSEDFVEAFNFGWAVDFLKKTFRESFLAWLFLMLSSAILGVLGMLACYIGLFFVMPPAMHRPAAPRKGQAKFAFGARGARGAGAMSELATGRQDAGAKRGRSRLCTIRN